MPPAERWTIGVLLLAALAIRAPLVADPPFDIAPSRQHHSALTSRGLLFRMQPDVPEWRRRVVEDYLGYARRLEPPVIETTAALAFRATGRETLAIPRALSALYWLVGGGFLYLVARRLTSPAGAALAAAVYLFHPWAVRASVSYQPDPLAVAALCAGLWAVLRLDDGSLTAWRAAMPAALAMFVRVMTGLFLYPVYAGLLVRRALARPRATGRGAADVLLDRRVWLYAAVSAAPMALYYLHALVTRPGVRRRASMNFVGDLLGMEVFWRGWWQMIGETLTVPVFLAAIAAVAGFRMGRPRAVVLGLWIGYVAYGLLFTLHTHTHPYYQTLALPMVALSLAGLAPLVVDRLPAALRAGVTLALVAGLAVWGGSVPAAADEYGPKVADYQAAGAAAGHTLRAVFMTDHWGTPLRYHGEVSGRYWPTRFEIGMYEPLGDEGIPDLAPAARLGQLRAEMGGADFFIVTDLAELGRQPDLARLLDDRFRVAARGERYVVYDLRPAPGPVPRVVSTASDPIERSQP
jgi:hypothetical protein